MAEGPDGSPLNPVLIDGTGRDGTTLMMQLLGTSPEVAFDRIYPYEQRYFSYLLHWSRIPQLDEWEIDGWNLDSLGHLEDVERLAVVGALPWPERSLISDPDSELWQDLFEAGWTAFSKRARKAVRSRLGDPEQPIRFYAQKVAESWLIPVDKVPVPELRICHVLRDPRDTWQSSVAFHRRRLAAGEAFLPVGPDESEEVELGRFIVDQRERLRALLEEDQERFPVFRYERLVSDLPGEAKRLGDWLGAPLDAEAVQLRRGSFREHVTAGTIEQSVDRWRREMSAELAARFWSEMGDELEQFDLKP